MGIYKTVQSMLFEMAEDLATDENLMKYLVYDDTVIDPLTKPTISKPSQYIFNPQTYKINDSGKNDKFRIYQTPIPNITEKEKSFIVIWYKNSEKIRDDTVHKRYTIYFDVITHIDINVIVGGKERLFEMMDLIHEKYNEKYTNNSIQKLFPLDDMPIRYNDKFFGFRLPYHATAFSSDNIR